MGKVGSSSVTGSLRAAKIDRPIYHVHFLTPELVDEYENKRRNELSTAREHHLKHIWQYQHLNKELKRRLPGDRWKIVTLVRDPIARNLSTFFTHIDVISSTANREWRLKSIEYDFEITINETNLEKLVDLFFERLNHDKPLVYFDQEFKGNLNIDLYASDFPKSKGYKIYEEKESDVLLIRLENLNDCLTKAFQEFLQIDNLTLIGRNIGSQKDYSDVYGMFKNIIRLPQSYIDKVYSAKFTRHFYSQNEIEKFRTKWTSNAPIL
jgi:hypothetical protein